jgi:hypothetical protein
MPLQGMNATFYLQIGELESKLTATEMLFISSRNQVIQNQSMLARSNCKALLYAEESTSTATPLRENLPQMLLTVVPSLDDIVQTSNDTKHYQFDKSFEEIQNEPCLILHSSGSTGRRWILPHHREYENLTRTGNPKLVTLTHGTFAVTDNDRNMPTPVGRRAQNTAQFNFPGAESSIPAFHRTM